MSLSYVQYFSICLSVRRVLLNLFWGLRRGLATEAHQGFGFVM